MIRISTGIRKHCGHVAIYAAIFSYEDILKSAKYSIVFMPTNVMLMNTQSVYKL